MLKIEKKKKKKERVKTYREQEKVFYLEQIYTVAKFARQINIVVLQNVTEHETNAFYLVHRIQRFRVTFKMRKIRQAGKKRRNVGSEVRSCTLGNLMRY